MKKKGLSQEGLKLIACLSMLLDHIGYRFAPGAGLRIAGRIAFPIYCFLLVEGVHHTKNPRRYGLRLLLSALLSELPFDLLFYDAVTWQHQSVMVTLLLGFCMAERMERARIPKLAPVLPFCLAAEVLRTDYGAMGVAVIAVFAITREMPYSRWIQTAGLAILCLAFGGMTVELGPVMLPIELFAVLAMIPIACYSGAKRTASRAVQWGFYMFYPVHLIVLWIIWTLTH